MWTRDSRSWVRLVACVVAGALIGAGCGGSGDSSGDEGGGAAATEAAFPVEEGAYPATIEHKFGETTIEEEPERVVTVGLTDQDALLALGVVPVGTVEWFGEQPGALWPWAQERLEEIGGEQPEVMGESADRNFEAVAAQRPDLILAVYSGLEEEDYERLSEIAPTVAQPADVIDYGVAWDEATRTIGRAVGRPDAAEGVVEDVQARIDQVRQDHPEFEGASSVMATPYEGIFLYGPSDARGRFLSALGFELPADLIEATGEEYGGNLSQERADLLDVDVLIWLDPEDAEGPLGGPLYETFAVHTEGREVFLDSFDDPLGGATSFITALSIPYLLDGLVPRLAAAVDGDPSTEVPT
jgi:iron complex transport system substrate-binding protein